MKIFIEDDRKITVYSLPTKIEDEYVINYFSAAGIEENITLIAENDKWTISSNPGASILKNGTIVSKQVLENDGNYTLSFSDLEYDVNLYTYDIPIKYEKYDLNTRTEIVFGGQSTYDVSHNNLLSPHYRIYRNNNAWVLETNQNAKVFVNNKRCFAKFLQLGDIIFTNGLKLIWMNSHIIINNPNNGLTTSLPKYTAFEPNKENEFTPVKETEKNIVLYNDKQVFFHTPRFKNEITDKNVKIEFPPKEKKKDDTPAIFTYGATIVMGMSSAVTGVIAIFGIMKGTATLASSITEITICVTMIIGMIMLPMMQLKYNDRKIKKDEAKRQKVFGEYLNKKREEIQNELNNEKSILLLNNLSPQELENAIVNKTHDVWGREILDDDFLTLRLGVGNKNSDITIEIPEEEFSMEDDTLKDEVKNMKNTKLVLENVPITISLVDYNVFPIIIGNDYKQRKQIIDWLSLQLMAYYSGVDLKIIIFTSRDREDEWECFKYLPHCYSDDRQMRFFATNEDEYKNVTHYLEDIYNKRKEEETELSEQQNANYEATDKYKLYNEYFLIITDNYVDIKDYEILNNIINKNSNYGFSILILENLMSEIPSKCKKFVEIRDTACNIYDKSNNNDKVQFNPDFFDRNLAYYSRILANIPLTSLKAAQTLPTSYTFLEMFKVGKIEQLNIANRWAKNDPTMSLHTPIGVKEDGKTMELDLHEKYHGPHGLIAGSTGSGKSEFIITFILSMAVNYHPYEVQFVLIDYKGGGLAGAFENRETGVKIPHLVGTITNLDTNEMNRTLVSINSELKRREKVFNAARDKLGESTVDIYKYQQFYRDGKVDEPVSHLFIISDEFAELKDQQPEFMDELVSTARIGRSLGVHLILATQKPSGVVNDQIWSNSKFKICLKVQTSEDSNELLRRPDAASIKETGRFYLQVGYNELFVLAQSGWAGAKYIPTERITKNYDDDIEIIDNNGNIIKSVNDNIVEANVESKGEQLTNLVKFLNDIAIRDNIKTTNLWLPSIPPEIFLINVSKKYNYKPEPYHIVPIIGEYDNPSQQKQDILTMDLTNNGNLMIFGNTGSGKENLLSTMIFSTVMYHSTNEVNFYIFDFGAETLKVFNLTPHVGDVVTIDEKEKIKSGLLFLDRELARRKERYSQYGGSYKSYIQSSEEKDPLITVIINSYDSFSETYPEYSDYMGHLFRDGSKYGIVYIVACTALGALPTSYKNYFSNQIAMRLADDFDYKFTFMAPYGLTPAKFFGRGIITMDGVGYEFQTALIYTKNEINETIKHTNQLLREKYENIHHIPIIPLKVTAESLSQYLDKISNVPIGINVNTGDIVKHDFTKNRILQIIGNRALQSIELLDDLIKEFKNMNNCEAHVIDFVQSTIDQEDIYYASDEFTPSIKDIIEFNKDRDNKHIFIVLGASKVYDYVLDEGVDLFNKILYNISKLENIGIILVDNYPNYRKLSEESWFNNKDNSLLWLDEDVKIQNIFNTEKITTTDVNEEFPGLGYYINGEKYEVIKCIGIRGEE